MPGNSAYDEEMRERWLAAGAMAALAMGAGLSVQQRLAQWKPVEMPRRPGCPPRERQMVDKLVEACRLLDDVYWRQSDLAGLALYNRPPTRN